ncbi:MAG: hypothetical protein Q9226_008102 [Calogaya cf. arnoldii]
MASAVLSSSPEELLPNMLPENVMTEEADRMPVLETDFKCGLLGKAPACSDMKYWAPEHDKDGNLEAYFRGRKLKGREVTLPKGYKGVVVEGGANEDEAHKRNTERLRRRQLEEEGEDEDEEEGAKVMEEVANFKDFIIWGHEAVVDGDDAFVRSVEEWIGFAAAVGRHGWF